MKYWDLASGAAKFEEALESLEIAWKQSADHWNDDARRQFEEEYLVPMGPRAHRALDAMHRLTELLAKAQRECDEE